MDERSYRDAEQRWLASQGLETTEQRVHLRRLDVEVRVQEAGTGEAVLFLHGGPNTGAGWAQLMARLPDFRCLMLDRPGTGLSDPLPDPVRPHNMIPYAETLAVDVLDALGLERVHVVASSFGGMIALRSAAAHPERFDRMVQLGCPALVPGMRTPPFMRIIMTPGLGRLIGALPPGDRANRSIMRQIGHGASLDSGRLSEDMLAWYLALQRHTDTMDNERRMIASGGSVRGFDRALTIPDSVLARVETPSYFLWGEDDAFGGADVARGVVAAMPSAELEMLPATGHLPWLDDPDQVARGVTAFLARAVH